MHLSFGSKSAYPRTVTPFSLKNDPQYNHNSQISQKNQVGNPVSPLIMQRLHLRAPTSAPVAARLHRHRQIRRAAERRYEKWYQNRDHALCPLYEIARFKISASRHLCLHDLIRLLNQNRERGIPIDDTITTVEEAREAILALYNKRREKQ